MRISRAVIVAQNQNLVIKNEEQRREINRLQAQIAGYQDELLKAKAK